MLYLTGCVPKKPHLRQSLLDNGFGALLTPYSVRSAPNNQWPWAADNGCYSDGWEEKVWDTWIHSRPEPYTALFATVPDVVANHEATLDRWHQYAPTVINAGYKAAFVLQDGATIETLPMNEMGALFIGGSTEYKLSDEARSIVEVCKEAGKWVHMGRVNSLRRLRIAKAWGCDSVDGTFLAFAPDFNTPRLIKMLSQVNQPGLFDFLDTPPG
jgi:hypothetical protein